MDKPHKRLQAAHRVVRLEIIVGIREHGADRGGKDLPERSHQIRLGFPGIEHVVLCVGGRDQRMVQAADVMLLQDFDRLFRLAEHKITLGNLILNHGLADFGIGVLRQQQHGALQQLDAAAQMGLVFLLNARRRIQPAGGEHDAEYIRVAQQRFLGLGNAFLIFFPALQHLDSLFERGCAAVPHFKPDDRVQRHAEQIRHFREKAQVRRRHAALPFRDGSKGDPQGLRQLFLCHAVRSAQFADVGGKR